jgi:flagellar motor protein MotB
MARDPFAELDGSALTPGNSHAKGAGVFMRVVSAVSVLALLGLLLGYYVPLRKAHTLLSDKYQSKAAELGGTADQLKKTTDQLLKVQAERDQLKGDAEKAEEAKSGEQGDAEKTTTALEQALSKLVKGKQVSVQTRGLATVVTIDDKQLFGKRDTAPNPKGKKLLCEIAKAIKTLPEKTEVEVSGHTATDKVADPVLKRDFPTAWELSAIHAAGTVSALEDCGLPRNTLKASGVANTRPEDSTPKGSTGELRLSLTPRG